MPAINVKNSQGVHYKNLSFVGGDSGISIENTTHDKFDNIRSRGLSGHTLDFTNARNITVSNLFVDGRSLSESNYSSQAVDQIYNIIQNSDIPFSDKQFLLENLSDLATSTSRDQVNLHGSRFLEKLSHYSSVSSAAMQFLSMIFR